jgi:hypothetical protein
MPSARRVARASGWALPFGLAGLVLIIATGALLALTNRPDAVAPPHPTTAQYVENVPRGDSSVLYRADWSRGLGGWLGMYGWSANGGFLRNDGSDFGDANWVGGLWNRHWVGAPYIPPPDLAHYAVEAEIDLLGMPDCGSFGLVVAGIQVGVHMCEADAPSMLSVRSREPELLLDEPLGGVDGPHLYRVEVHPTTMLVMMDGVRVGKVSDLSTAPGRPVGVWDDHTEIAMRQFRVVRVDAAEP